MEKAPAASVPPAEDDKLIEIQHAEPVEATWSLRRPRTRRTLVASVAAAARLRAHRPEHHADDEARDRRGADSGKEIAARARPPQAPRRLDGFGVLDLDQFVIFGRRRACYCFLLHDSFAGLGAPPLPWCFKSCPRREAFAAPRGPACRLCVSHTRRCKPQAGSLAARASEREI